MPVQTDMKHMEKPCLCCTSNNTIVPLKTAPIERVLFQHFLFAMVEQLVACNKSNMQQINMCHVAVLSCYCWLDVIIIRNGTCPSNVHSVLKEFPHESRQHARFAERSETIFKVFRHYSSGAMIFLCRTKCVI